MTEDNIPNGKRLQLKGNEVLVVEGIHALNPELTTQIPDEQKFRLYASAYRLLKFLRYIQPIPEDQIPPSFVSS